VGTPGIAASGDALNTARVTLGVLCGASRISCAAATFGSGARNQDRLILE
jgi:hypothetical protein